MNESLLKKSVNQAYIGALLATIPFVLLFCIGAVVGIGLGICVQLAGCGIMLNGLIKAKKCLDGSEHEQGFSKLIIGVGCVGVYWLMLLIMMLSNDDTGLMGIVRFILFVSGNIFMWLGCRNLATNEFANGAKLLANAYKGVAIVWISFVVLLVMLIFLIPVNAYYKSFVDLFNESYFYPVDWVMAMSFIEIVAFVALVVFIIMICEGWSRMSGSIGQRTELQFVGNNPDSSKEDITMKLAQMSNEELADIVINERNMYRQEYVDEARKILQIRRLSSERKN